YPIAIISKVPDYVEFIDIDGVQKKINKKKNDWSTISLVQALDNGIWTVEALFQNTDRYAVIGIVRDSYDIPANAWYSVKPHTDHIAAFCGKNCDYPVWYKYQGTYGNAEVHDNQILRLEFDSFKGTLILFIDNVQQPVYFSGIKEKVRFIDDIDLDPDGDDDDVFSAKDIQQFEVFIAVVLSPLYNQQEPNKLVKQKSHLMIALQLITLSVYRVVGPSPDPSRITYYPGITQT
ncbi:MAG: hypothetical protein EZS28_040095, partial [Streblomastix strix]